MIRFSGNWVLVLGLLVFLGSAESANILGIFTVPQPSHVIVHMSLAKVLAERGHNLTIITSIEPPIKHKNFNIIRVPHSKDEERDLNEALVNMAKIDGGVLSQLLNMPKFFDVNSRIMTSALRDPRVVDLYENKDNHFDLVIAGYFMNNFQLGLAQKLKVPVIISFSQQPVEFMANMVGNPRSLSHVPGILTAVEKGQVMSFSQRFHTQTISWLQRIWLAQYDWNNSKIYRSLYGDDPSMTAYEDLSKNISLMFFNSHALSEGPIRPNVPAVVEIGGIQIKNKPDLLPLNMAEFLGNATKGAILLSLGSNLKGSHLTPEMVQSMFKVLSNLPQRVIWKWDDLKNTPGTSDNILYSKWLPQDDILAHPNIKLFITHAGKGGTSESQYHGKPMLAIPFFGDQPGNAGVLVKSGYGLSLSSLDLNEENFRSSIVRILEDPSFTNNVKAFSDLYRDRPLTAQETVIYWTEYVLRHRGAPHLQSPVVHMSFIAYHNIDIYIILILILSIVVVLTKFVFKLCIRKISNAKKPKIKRK
ncbi:UDP-glycosyltransferase UGT5-like [Drosophila bipectinata]|uniref:UDP-glycosyltransferase UGT5-like n=1 Tax=Drosophila bipectinata TaxID=42026 RepID=UPI0038B2BACE